MLHKFQNPVMVVIYLFGCLSLFWHLLHGFQSAFQSLGLNHVKYNRAISFVGISFFNCGIHHLRTDAAVYFLSLDRVRCSASTDVR